MTEQLIIEACKRKDRTGQRAFVDSYSRYLYSICYRYTTDKDLAQDCLQESLVQILNSFHSYKEQGRFKSWIGMITTNKCLEILRKEKRHTNQELTPEIEPGYMENSNVKLHTQEVMQFLKKLPDNYRIAINMFLVEGYNHKEIAQVLGITESSSRSLVTRGRRMIKDHFEKDNLRLIHKRTANG